MDQPDLDPLLSAREIAAGIPLFRDAREIAIRPLEGVVSLNNSNYRVTTDDAE